MRWILIAALGLLLGAAEVGAEPAIALSLEPDQVVDCGQIQNFVPFYLYILVIDAPPMDGLELSIPFIRDRLEPRLVALTLEPRPANCFCGEYFNFVAALGACTDYGAVGWFMRITFGWLVADPIPELPLCIAPAWFPWGPRGPGYSDCHFNVHPFALGNLGDQGAPIGCLAINPTEGCRTVDTRAKSWSALKSSFE
jgi:hypothetical protein